MHKLTSGESQVSNSWNTYWKGTGDVGAFTSGGASHPAIKAFWGDFFNAAKQKYTSPNIIDIATGNGAVVESALSIFENTQSELTALDISSAAIENIHRRFPTVKGIVSDASSIPLENKSFDIVTSQFGVEYAGSEAIFEAARLVAKGGVLALLLHCHSGSIHQECLQSYDAIKRMQDSQFIPFAIEMLDAGFKAIRGANRSPYEDAATRLAPAIKELEAIMTQYGPHVAGDTIARLYNDVAQIHERIRYYEPSDVLNWLSKMAAELSLYTERMLSMSKSAIDSVSFELITAKLEELDFSIETADKLFVPEHEQPMAWVIIAKT